MKFSLFTNLFLICLLYSCKQGATERIDLLYNQVMEVHDKVMPEMGTISKNKSVLKSLKTTENDSIILHHINQLEIADEAMMSWMADFNPPDQESLKEAYLIGQKAQIDSISQLMQATIAASETVIASLKQ
jgi:hypothetical protein